VLLYSARCCERERGAHTSHSRNERLRAITITNTHTNTNTNTRAYLHPVLPAVGQVLQTYPPCQWSQPWVVGRDPLLVDQRAHLGAGRSLAVSQQCLQLSRCAAHGQDILPFSPNNLSQQASFFCPSRKSRRGFSRISSSGERTSPCVCCTRAILRIASTHNTFTQVAFTTSSACWGDSSTGLCAGFT
jgi:hypothetical protein